MLLHAKSIAYPLLYEPKDAQIGCAGELADDGLNAYAVGGCENWNCFFIYKGLAGSLDLV
ncbi:MAG TPA: hypothetical protein VHC39_09015 [Rhizomicrobium sp.]|nr:hypothetical protein [Rhizomicrobium sp.]